MSTPGMETLAELLARIEATEVAPEFQPKPYTVDWGKMPRGQGKRFGRGPGRMVMGAMSAVPMGKRTYLEQVPGEPEEVRQAVNRLEPWERVTYLRARSAGLPHPAAECVAWARGDTSGDWTPEVLTRALAEDGVLLADVCALT